jgi:phenylpropionate dioxygenase-like ring-hydroxylating dioxygenase large terminal subunit
MSPESLDVAPESVEQHDEQIASGGIALDSGDAMLREYWYIACASSRLGEEEPKAVRILDQQIAVYRDKEGKPHAVFDRCCHRGVPLSIGRVTEGHIACGYHGWQFDGEGKCVHIPSLTKDRRIPKGFDIQAFPCVEQDGYIWVWMGAKEPDPALPSPIDGWADYSWKQGVIIYDADMVKLIENQFDCCHPAFVHPETHPAYHINNAFGFREVELETRITDEGMVFYTPAVAAEQPIPEKPFSKIELMLPNRIWVSLRMASVTFRTAIHYVPMGKNKSRMEFAMQTGPGHKVKWTDDEGAINIQDRIVEQETHWYERGDEFERSVEADFPMLMIRQIYRLAFAGEWKSKKDTLQQRRVIRVRV